MVRGLVIVIMAIDHVRDFTMVGTEQDPMTNPNISAAVFFTRWITHFCAPVFVLLAGTSAGLMTARKSRHALAHPALDEVAKIVRAADTSTLDRSQQAAGLLAASLGLSAMFADDHAMLKWGMLVYDSLYAWARDAQTETHGWYPEKLRARATA